MKNIFSWPVIVSILTVFFYWYGYWFRDGYISFFGHNIQAYDIPVQHLIISGFLRSSDVFIWLIVLFFVISLFSQFSNNQFMIAWSKLHRVFLYIYFYTKKLFNLSKRGDAKSYVFILVTDDLIHEKNILKPLPKITNISLQESTFKKSNLKKICRKIVNKIEVINASIGKNNSIKLINKDIKKLEKAAGSEILRKFNTQYTLHTLLLFMILGFILYNLNHTPVVVEKGYEEAQMRFDCTVEGKKNCYKFSKIDLESSQTWYLTDICIRSSCLTFNEKKEAKFVDMVGKEFDMRKVNIRQH